MRKSILRVDSFGDHDVGESRIKVVFFEQLFHFANFLFLHLGDLSISYTVTVHDDSSRVFSIYRVVFLQCSGKTDLDLLQVLLVVSVESAG